MHYSLRRNAYIQPLTALAVFPLFSVGRTVFGRDNLWCVGLFTSSPTQGQLGNWYAETQNKAPPVWCCPFKLMLDLRERRPVPRRKRSQERARLFVEVAESHPPGHWMGLESLGTGPSLLSGWQHYCLGFQGKDKMAPHAKEGGGGDWEADAGKVLFTLQSLLYNKHSQSRMTKSPLWLFYSLNSMFLNLPNAATL